MVNELLVTSASTHGVKVEAKSPRGTEKAASKQAAIDASVEIGRAHV